MLIFSHCSWTDLGFAHRVLERKLRLLLVFLRVRIIRLFTYKKSLISLFYVPTPYAFACVLQQYLV